MTGFLGPNGPAGPASSNDPRLQELSDREREVLVAIGNGWTNTEIAERLVLSESTVKKHVGRVLAKIGARDRIQAVILSRTTPGSSGPSADRSPPHQDATREDRTQLRAGDWKVCSQLPGPGIHAVTSLVAVTVVKSGERCPRA